MRITPNFNRFYHGAILGDLYRQMQARKSICITFEKFKDALKYANKEYPRTEGGDIVSTKEISSADLTAHLEWVRAWAANYGLTLSVDEEEWSRVIESIRE